jgi:beta-glucosidase
MIPYYGMPVNTKYEEVGFAFSRSIVNDLLREQLGFCGIVCTDWALMTDASIMGQNLPSRAWGCEHLNQIQSVQKIIEVGCNQFGGETCTQNIMQLVRERKVQESRNDESVRRVLREKFLLGLFDNPFFDVDIAVSIVWSSTEGIYSTEEC